MEEFVSPSNRRTLAVSRLLSPASTFFVSNDDNLERAQARAARVATIRRKSVAFSAAAAAAPPPASVPYLDKHQILDLFNNCIKLASENKINQKNTWELGLIDHLCDVLKVEEEDDTETNFQKAGCTLEAGVKIYSTRVDYLHSETYKVLGAINRVGQEKEDSVEDAGSKYSQGEGNSKKGADWKGSPLSTLESSFEALNVKKFDVAFTVDPLYHQTSAQFDEGGAKGLLLNHLGIYGSCQVLFDSFEVPGKSMKCGNQPSNQDTIDLSFAKDCIDKMVVGMHSSEEISPTLKHIVNLFGESNRRPSNTFTSVNHLQEQFHETCNETHNRDNAELELDDNEFDNGETWAFENADQDSVVGEDLYGGDPIFGGYHEEGEPNLENRFDNVGEYMYMSLGLNSKLNAWAGPDHWRYRKEKGLPEASKEDGLPEAKKPKSKRPIEVNVDIMRALDNEIPDIFAPPKNPKLLLLPANRAHSNTKLPEDCHYQPKYLVKLFVLPKVMFLGRRKGRKSSAEECGQEKNADEPTASWEDNAFIGQLGIEDDHSDIEDLNNLVPQPRQVNKIEVKYDKLSKQVDVQALKETLWVSIQTHNKMTTQDDKEAEATVSFREVLAGFPSDCKAGAIEDLSIHLSFICLLHLANEHGLSILGSSKLDDLTIHLPSK